MKVALIVRIVSILVTVVTTLLLQRPLFSEKTTKTVTIPAKQWEKMLQEFDELKQQVADNVDRLDQNFLDTLEDIEYPNLMIYGFLDITFAAHFAPKGGFFEDFAIKPSFLLQHINLNFASDITENIKAQVELRFTFFTVTKHQVGIPGIVEYELHDTSISDPESTEKINLHGLSIERATFAYQPYDWFGIKAGHFFSPFSFYNLDHSSVIYLGLRQPEVVWRQYIPISQTGIQIYGRFFPFDSHILDYAITISNGRNPMGEAIDIDDNKALGLRLKWTYNENDMNAILGAYGYWGIFTDEVRNIEAFEPLTITRDAINQYQEMAAAIDFKIEKWGILFQSEYICRWVKYLKRGAIDPQYGSGFMPDYMEMAYYILIAYTLPLDDLLGDSKIKPYAQFCDLLTNLEETGTDGTTIFVGLNALLNPNIAVKFEYFYVLAQETKILHNPTFYGIGVQLAVGF
jgi:hypothetical protein